SCSLRMYSFCYMRSWPTQNKLSGSVMVCISLDQGVAPSEGVALLEWVCQCGCGYKILTLVAWVSSTGNLWMKT
ncbi:mCG1039011, partial [Mus musculus]